MQCVDIRKIIVLLFKKNHFRDERNLYSWKRGYWPVLY